MFYIGLYICTIDVKINCWILRWMSEGDGE